MTVHTPIEARSRRVPAWALGLTVFLLLVGGVYLAGNLAGSNPPIIALPSPSGSAGPNPRQLIAQAGCESCHGPDLGGQATFPSLHGVKDGPVSENLQDLGAERPDDWANLWIAGTDPAVTGLDRGGMPIFGETYSEQEIAAMVDFLKTLP